MLQQLRLPSPIFLEVPRSRPSWPDKVKVYRRNKKLIAFGWYGGKFSHLDWLLPHLPDCHHYCEPFGGSAAVLLNRRPSSVETFNDIDGEVTNFFRVLRNQTEKLIKAVALTPFSREEYFWAVSKNSRRISDLERARHFYIRARQSRTGLAQMASLGRWANCKNTSRAGMSGVVSRWLGSVEGLPEIAERLIRVQIENRPAVDIIKLYDDNNTLFYCDPPYPHEARGDVNAYSFEMKNDEHAQLAAALSAIKGKAAISSYRCDLMDTLYKAWSRIEAPPKKCHSVKQFRTEALWMNY
jgi:DNA adenine methylase